MNLRSETLGALLGLALASGVGLYARAVSEAKPGVDWPQFRGIRATGVAEGFALPASWDVAKGQSVAWKTAVPGLGLSSPIVWGDLVCVSTSISGQKDAGLKVGLYGDVKPVLDDTEHEWRLYCLDKKTGAIRWQQTVTKAVPKIKRHTKASHANSTLATDGERLIAFFGSEGLYAYDLKGKQVWKKDFLVCSMPAGSPIRQRNGKRGARRSFTTTSSSSRPTCREDRFCAAFDARNGQELWRVARSDVPTWGHRPCTRSTARHSSSSTAGGTWGRTTSGPGKEIWRLTGGGDIPVPTPVVSDGLIFITNAHGPKAPSTPSAKRRPATLPLRTAPRATLASPGARRATAATCARRSSTVGWCTS